MFTGREVIVIITIILIITFVMPVVIIGWKIMILRNDNSDFNDYDYCNYGA